MRLIKRHEPWDPLLSAVTIPLSEDPVRLPTRFWQRKCNGLSFYGAHTITDSELAQLLPAVTSESDWNFEVDEISLPFNMSHEKHAADPTHGRTSRDFTYDEREKARNARVPQDRESLLAALHSHYEDGCVKNPEDRYIKISPMIGIG